MIRAADRPQPREPQGYTVKGFDAGETTELETFDRLSDARAYAIDTVTRWGWMSAYVRHNGRTVYRTDDDPNL